MNKNIFDDKSEVLKLAEDKLSLQLGDTYDVLPGQIKKLMIGLQSKVIELEKNEEGGYARFPNSTEMEKYKNFFSEMKNGAALHELIFDNSGNPVDYVTTEVNSMYELLLNVNKELVIGKKASEILPSDELVKWLNIFAPVAITGESTEYRLFSPVNQKQFEGIVFSPGKNKFAVIFSDVTQHNLMEKEFQNSEKKLKKAQSYAHLGSWTWNIQTNELEWSDEMFKIFGIEKESFSGLLADVIADAIHPDDRQKVIGANSIVINHGEPIPLEYRVIWPDGSVHTLRAEAGEELLDSEGNPSQLSGFVLDITRIKNEEQLIIDSEEKLKKLLDSEKMRIQELAELNSDLKNARVATLNIIEDLSIEVEERKKTEEEVKSQRNTLAAIFESSPYIMMLVDREGRVKNINREGIEFAGKEKSSLMHLLGGEVFNCLNSFEGPGCGRNAECLNCPIRSRVNKTFISGENIHNGEGRMSFMVNGSTITLDLLISTSLVAQNEGDLVLVTIVDITERKKAELELQDAQTLTKAIVDSTSDLIWSVDSENFGILNFNHSLEVYYQLNRGIKLQTGLTPNDLFPADEYVNKWEGFYKQALATGSYTTEYYGYLENHTLQLTFNLLKREGQVFGISVFGKDVTEQKIWEEQVRKLSLAVEQSPVTILITDIMGNIEYVNPKFTEITGFTFNEVQYKNIRILTPGEHTEVFYKNLWETILAGKAWSGVLRSKKKNGELFWESAKISPIINESGEINSFIIVKEDITEKVQIEKELKKYRENLEELVEQKTYQLTKQNVFFRTLIDTIPNPIYVKDKEFKFTEINRAYEEFFNFKRENIIGKTIFEIAPPEAAKTASQYDEQLLIDHKTTIYESFAELKERGKIPILVYKSSFGLFGNKPEGISGMLIDISKQKELEQTTLDALKKEKELNEMKSNFISIASHEFRTPLTTILSSTDLLDAYHKKWDAVKIGSHLKKIQSSVKYMITMLDEVLTISRSDRGKIDFHPSLLNIDDFCSEIIEQVKLQSTSKHKILYRNKLSNENIIADPKLLDHILNNLLTNAIKFSPEGGNVVLTVEDEGDLIIFTVKDKGIGIPPEDQAKLFEPFFRAKNSTGIKGTGLGLSIVKRYVNLHNGELSIESKPGKGTKFFVRIRKTIL